MQLSGPRVHSSPWATPTQLEGVADRRQWRELVQHYTATYGDGGRSTAHTEALLLAQWESFARAERLDGRGIADLPFAEFEAALSRQRAAAATCQDDVPPALLRCLSPIGQHLVYGALLRRLRGEDRAPVPGWLEGRGVAIPKAGKRKEVLAGWRAITVVPAGAKLYEAFWWQPADGLGCSSADSPGQSGRVARPAAGGIA